MMQKKALIVTFHCVPNYGAALQTYGLYWFLKKIFQDVEVLDYRPSSLTGDYKYISTHSLRSFVATLWSLPTFWRKRRRFANFVGRMSLSATVCHSSAEIKETDAQYCFVGSDQIWNPDITKSFDEVYFGKIPHKGALTVISYAASLGKDTFTSSELAQMFSLLKGVSSISVREDSAKVLLEDKLGVQACVVLDPTLLVGTPCYKDFVVDPNRDDYLFIYALSQNTTEQARAVARKIANAKGLQIVEVSGGRKRLKRTSHKVIYDASPAEFLSLLANAKYVVTDSFHGTAFSLLFHRQFTTIPHKTRGGRMVSLLTLAGLKHRLTEQPSQEIIEETIDWSAVDSRLEIARKQSEDFILKSINKSV